MGAAARHGEAAVPTVPLLLRRTSGLRGATLPGLCRRRQLGPRQRTRRNRGGLGSRFNGRNGFQPAMVPAHSRACALSVTPGNSRRSSTAAENSPRCSNAARIAAASASLTTNIAGAWARTVWPATRRHPWNPRVSNRFDISHRAATRAASRNAFAPLLERGPGHAPARGLAFSR